MAEAYMIPTSVKEVEKLGWDWIDVILFSGDAFVDHPSFGTAVIARWLQKWGYRVAVVPQPNWRDDLRDFRKLGRPRLYFGVNAGAMDSMVNHYTASKRLRSDDAYTPDGRAGARPDYAVSVYTRILKQLYPDVPVVIGGIEASLRRLTHYDYWKDCLMPSVLVSSGADWLCYGMGERPMLELTRAIEADRKPSDMRRIPQLAFRMSGRCRTEGAVFLHSYECCLKDKKAFAENFNIIETAANMLNPPVLVEPVGDGYVQVNPSYPPATQEEMDSFWDLPYTKLPHPRYQGHRIPAYDMIKFSVTTHRGCFGGCNFCTIAAHQGKFIQSRSEDSIIREIRDMTSLPGFAGNISDVGYIACEAGEGGHIPYFAYDGIFAARLYELALVGGDSAEIAASETASVRGDRELDHIVGRYAVALVARMRQLGVRQVPERVHFLLSCRRIGRIHLHVAVADRLHQHRRVQHICSSLYYIEILRKGLFVLQAALVGVEEYGAFGTAASAHPEGQLGDAAHIRRLAVRFDGARQFQHRPLPHTVAEPVGAAAHEHRRHKAVLPVVVVGEAPQRGLDAADHDRHVGIELFENTGIYADRVVRPRPRPSVGRVGVVAAQTFRRGVVIDHRVHSSRIHSEIEAGTAQFAEVAQVVPPVGLGNHCHPVAPLLEPSGDYGGTERRVVHEGVTAEEDDVYPVPPELFHLLDGGRYHICFCHKGLHPFRKFDSEQSHSLGEQLGNQ